MLKRTLTTESSKLLHISTILCIIQCLFTLGTDLLNTVVCSDVLLLFPHSSSTLASSSGHTSPAQPNLEDFYHIPLGFPEDLSEQVYFSRSFLMGKSGFNTYMLPQYCIEFVFLKSIHMHNLYHFSCQKFSKTNIPFSIQY